MIALIVSAALAASVLVLLLAWKSYKDARKAEAQASASLLISRQHYARADRMLGEAIRLNAEAQIHLTKAKSLHGGAS